LRPPKHDKIVDISGASKKARRAEAECGKRLVLIERQFGRSRMKMRGLNDPLLMTSDGANGMVKAIEVCFPRAVRQRYLAHRMRNLASKVPEEYGRSSRHVCEQLIKRRAVRLHVNLPPASWPTMAVSMTAQWHASGMTSKGASPICASQ
jgi:hypothetical protein